ncbi:MAG: HAD family hydrolase [Lysobacter sp.]|nr:HAD family hydrolase [Lysobacter sp.]
MTLPPIAAPVVDPASIAVLPLVPRRALFLDRDGVINVNHGYVHSKEQTEWVPGIFELVGAAASAGLICVVVTNQAGIARGYYDETQFRSYTEWMHGEFRDHGVPLLATYHCPHHPEAGPHATICACRKPAPGMLLAALRDFDIDPARSLMIGDKPGDIEAAVAAGIGHAHQAAEHDLSSAFSWLGQQLDRTT